MSTAGIIILVVVLLLLFGGGGYYGHSGGYFGHGYAGVGGYSLFGILLLVLLIMFLTGNL